MVNPPTIEVASLGMADSLFLMLLALVVFGPRRLPQIGRQIGKLMYEFRKASNDFKFQMEEELRNAEEADRRKKEEAERQKALAAGTTAAAPPAPDATQPFTGGYMNAPVAATPGESEALKVEPPSTGELVPGPHPTRYSEYPYPASEPEPAVEPPPAAQPEPATEIAPDADESAAGATHGGEPAVQDAAAATEQESHHG